MFRYCRYLSAAAADNTTKHEQWYAGRWPHVRFPRFAFSQEKEAPMALFTWHPNTRAWRSEPTATRKEAATKWTKRFRTVTMVASGSCFFFFFCYN